MRILAAYKPSGEGTAVLAAAVEEALLRDADLLIVRHVKRDQAAVEMPEMGVSTPTAQAPTRDESGQEISKLREEMDTLKAGVEAKGVRCEAVLLEGADDQVEAILGQAEEQGVGLIVVGIRRRSRVGKMLLGSQAQEILLNADCPVLAVKAD